jgi:hypothetical protein
MACDAIAAHIGPSTCDVAEQLHYMLRTRRLILSMKIALNGPVSTIQIERESTRRFPPNVNHSESKCKA